MGVEAVDFEKNPCIPAIADGENNQTAIKTKCICSQ